MFMTACNEFDATKYNDSLSLTRNIKWKASISPNRGIPNWDKAHERRHVWTGNLNVRRSLILFQVIGVAIILTI